MPNIRLVEPSLETHGRNRSSTSLAEPLRTRSVNAEHVTSIAESSLGAIFIHSEGIRNFYKPW